MVRLPRLELGIHPYQGCVITIFTTAERAPTKSRTWLSGSVDLRLHPMDHEGVSAHQHAGKNVSGRPGSNRRPSVRQTDALPTALRPRGAADRNRTGDNCLEGSCVAATPQPRVTY
jgi:hypothetical protein